jgi:polysaccharide biosynthesis protein PslL
MAPSAPTNPGLHDTRDPTVDIARGIGIVLVVFAHLPWGFNGYDFMHRVIYNFHMPLFFALGGCFFTRRSFLAFVERKAKTILFPYFIFLCFFYVLPDFIWMLYKGTPFGNENIRSFVLAVLMANGSFFYQAGINLIMWFLPCYFFYSCLLYVVARESRSLKEEIVRFAALFFSGFIVILVVSHFRIHYFLPWGIDIAIMALPFSYCGKYYPVIARLNPLVTGASLLLLIIISRYFTFDMQSLNVSNYPVFILLGFLGSSAVLQISFHLSKIKVGKILEYFGVRSLYIYGLHTFATVWISFFTVYIIFKNNTNRVIGTFFLDLLIPIALFELIRYCRPHWFKREKGLQPER